MSDGVLGIAPGPLKLETLLDAMIEAYDPDSFPDRERQYAAFRARILRMDAEKDEQIAILEENLSESKQATIRWIDGCNQLQGEIDCLRSKQ